MVPEVLSQGTGKAEVSCFSRCLKMEIVSLDIMRQFRNEPGRLINSSRKQAKHAVLVCRGSGPFHFFAVPPRTCPCAAHA